MVSLMMGRTRGGRARQRFPPDEPLNEAPVVQFPLSYQVATEKARADRPPSARHPHALTGLNTLK